MEGYLAWRSVSYHDSSWTVSGLPLHWLVYSSCSHLEHRASVKRFVSLQFLNLRHSVGLLGRVISPSQGLYLTQTQNKHRQISMPRVGYEPRIPVFERAKTVHALDRAGRCDRVPSYYTSVIPGYFCCCCYFKFNGASGMVRPLHPGEVRKLNSVASQPDA
jgi:hypothetical protein